MLENFLDTLNIFWKFNTVIVKCTARNYLKFKSIFGNLREFFAEFAYTHRPISTWSTKSLRKFKYLPVSIWYSMKFTLKPILSLNVPNTALTSWFVFVPGFHQASTLIKCYGTFSSLLVNENWENLIPSILSSTEPGILKLCLNLIEITCINK